MIQSPGHDRQCRHTGPYLASDRLAEYRINRLAGRFDTCLHYDLVEDRVPLRVTLLFDLSISMESPRHALGGQTPIQRAIQYATWLTAGLEAQGIETDAYGAVDGGARLCQLFRLPSPVSQSIQMLRCRGAGGFRLGAFIRAIASSPPELEMSKPVAEHKLLVFTDGDPGYLAMSHEQLFVDLHKSNCPNCTSRHRCKIEQAVGAINARREFGSIFQPLGYGLTDIGDAIQSTNPRTTVEVLLFSGSTKAENFDHFLGAEFWRDGCEAGL